jgi:hypothetical protein
MGQPAIGGSSAAAPQGGPFNSGVMGGLSALAHGYDKGGLLGGIADAFGARSPNEEQALNQTYQALIAKGVAPDMAKAAVLNPVLGQQVMSQAFKLPELADVGTDRWGNPIKGWANPVTQSIAPATISGSGQGGPLDGVGTMQGVANLIQNARQLGIQPIDALRKADPTTAGDVQAMIEGRTPISARSSKQQDMLMSLARMIDPSFDAGTFAARQKLRTEFTADGKDGQTIESAGQAIQHLHELSDMGQALHNVGGMGPLNAAVNWTQRGWRGLTQDQRTASFNEMKLLALKEVDKFYSGSGGGSAAEREELNDNINSASSPQQINGVIAHLTEAMGGKLAELDRKWRVGMGPSVAPYPVLSDESRARINDLQQRAGLQPSFPAGGAAGAPAGTREAVEAEMKRRGLL